MIVFQSVELIVNRIIVLQHNAAAGFESHTSTPPPNCDSNIFWSFFLLFILIIDMYGICRYYSAVFIRKNWWHTDYSRLFENDHMNNFEPTLLIFCVCFLHIAYWGYIQEQRFSMYMQKRNDRPNHVTLSTTCVQITSQINHQTCHFKHQSLP